MARGFTLIEILLVVAIMGIVGSLVALSSHSASGRVVETEAERLLQLMRFARDEAEVGGQALELQLSPQGYSFRRRDPRGNWQTVNGNELRPRQWPFPLAALHLEPVALGNRLPFEPGGRSPMFSLRIEAIERRIEIRGDTLGHYRLQTAQ